MSVGVHAVKHSMSPVATRKRQRSVSNLVHAATLHDALQVRFIELVAQGKTTVYSMIIDAAHIWKRLQMSDCTDEAYYGILIEFEEAIIKIEDHR